MPTTSIGSSRHSLLAGALHSFLVGRPRIPTHPTTEFPSPLSRLFAVGLCGLQLSAYFLNAVGGITLWGLSQWHGWTDPLKDSWVGSLAFEGWALLGPILGISILVMSRRWAVPSGIEWGWMGIRLGLFVLVVLYAGSRMGGLDPAVNVGLIIGVCLVLPAPLFWQLGSTTIYTIKALTPEHFNVRQRHVLLGENLIFLSYRREDSQAWTDRIANDLKEYFGVKAVFQDVEDIPPGTDFPERLKGPLQHCLVLLAVIGPGWISAVDEDGNRRLDYPKDWVSFEIKSALQQNIPIFPLLVADAKMPSEKDLPESIRKLALKNGLPIRANPDFKNDMNRLIRTLEDYLT